MGGKIRHSQSPSRQRNDAARPIMVEVSDGSIRNRIIAIGVIKLLSPEERVTEWMRAQVACSFLLEPGKKFSVSPKRSRVEETRSFIPPAAKI